MINNMKMKLGKQIILGFCILVMILSTNYFIKMLYLVAIIRIFLDERNNSGKSDKLDKSVQCSDNEIQSATTRLVD